MILDNFSKLKEYTKIPFEFSKKYSVLLFASGIGYGFIFNCATFTLALAIDRLDSSKFNLSLFIIPLSLYLLCMGLMFLINNLQSYYQKNLQSYAYIGCNRSLYTKKYRMNYIYNEDSKILDKFNMLGNFDENIVKYVNSLVFFVTLFVQLLFLFILITIYSFPAALLLCLFTVFTLVLVIKGDNATYEAHKRMQPLERGKRVIEDVLIDFTHGEERNLFNFGKYLSSRYQKKATESRKYTNKALATWFVKAQYGGIIFIFLTLITTFILSLSLLRDEMTFGLFVSLFSTLVQLSESMTWNLSDNIDNFIESSCKVRDYIDFLKLDESEFTESATKTISSKIHSIEFKNVSFTYSLSDKCILNNLNIKIESGKKYAVVGENGCGKTTIFKVLLGLYHHYDGEILFFNKNLDKLSIEEYRNDLCVVFQDFSNYFISIRDFLQLGTANHLAEDEIYEILDKLNVNLQIDVLSAGLDAPLGNILDEGNNISGGQWQKLCLARAILSKKSLLILDEPTSSIDPISELKIMETFKELCNDKTILYITHRLAAIKDCDSIFVLDAGTIVEHDKHDNLIRSNGLYKKMFDTQKSWYKNELGGDFLEGEN